MVDKGERMIRRPSFTKRTTMVMKRKLELDLTIKVSMGQNISLNKFFSELILVYRLGNLIFVSFLS